MQVTEDSYCLKVPYSVVQKRLVDEDVRNTILRKMSIRLSNVYASLGEQVRLADEWGESEPYIHRVENLMMSPAVAMSEETSAQDIAKRMVEESISSIMVVDANERLMGIITEKDLVRRVVAQHITEPLQAKDIMTKNPHTVSRHDYYYEVLSSFYKFGVKHLPVVEGDHLVGVVTLSNMISKRDRGSMGILKTIEVSSFDNLPIVKHCHI